MTIEDDQWMRELLAPLEKERPVPMPLQSRRRKRRAVVSLAGFVAAGLVAAGIAFADGVNPFAGVSAVNHPQTTPDVLDPTVVAQAQDHLPLQMKLLVDTSRLISALPSGRRMYVLATTTNQLAIIIVKNGHLDTESVGSPLTQQDPVTITTDDPDGPGGLPPLTYGVAQDGIIAVSFQASGGEQTVPVQNNVWVYEGENSALTSITLHYGDGTSRTISH